MNILIVYDSLYGNTEKIARHIAEEFKTEQVKIIKSKDATAKDFFSIELLIAGTPTHGGQPSQGMKDLLTMLPAGLLNNVKTAAFDTGIPLDGQKGFKRFIIRFIGYAAKRLAGILKKNGAIIIAAETFFVLDKEGPLKEGEIQRSAKWARELLNK
jgi:flavodoxin